MELTPTSPIKAYCGAGARAETLKTSRKHQKTEVPPEKPDLVNGENITIKKLNLSDETSKKSHKRLFFSP